MNKFILNTVKFIGHIFLLLGLVGIIYIIVYDSTNQQAFQYQPSELK